MDFTKFDTSAQAEAGRAFPILHPVTRKPMEQDGKTAMFIIRSPASMTAREAAKRIADEGEGKPLRTIPEIHEGAVKGALAYLAGFENVERDNRPATIADAEWFLNLTYPTFGDTKKGIAQTNYPFAQQVVDRAREFQADLGNV